MKRLLLILFFFFIGLTGFAQTFIYKADSAYVETYNEAKDEFETKSRSSQDVVIYISREKIRLFNNRDRKWLNVDLDRETMQQQDSDEGTVLMYAGKISEKDEAVNAMLIFDTDGHLISVSVADETISLVIMYVSLTFIEKTED